MLKAPNATPGHTDINDQRPRSHYFESIETGVGCYSWTALFDSDWCCLHSVLVDEPKRPEGDELVDVTHPAELRLLEVESVDWWEGR